MIAKKHTALLLCLLASLILCLAACVSAAGKAEQARRREDAAFRGALAQNSPESLSLFLSNFPGGPHSADAAVRMSALNAERLEAARRRAAEQRKPIDAYVLNSTTEKEFLADGWKNLGKSSKASDVGVVIGDHSNKSRGSAVCYHISPKGRLYELGAGGALPRVLATSEGDDATTVRLGPRMSGSKCTWQALLDRNVDAESCYVLVDLESETAADVLLFSGGDQPVLIEKLRIPIDKQ